MRREPREEEHPVHAAHATEANRLAATDEVAGLDQRPAQMVARGEESTESAAMIDADLESAPLMSLRTSTTTPGAAATMGVPAGTAKSVPTWPS